MKYEKFYRLIINLPSDKCEDVLFARLSSYRDELSEIYNKCFYCIITTFTDKEPREVICDNCEAKKRIQQLDLESKELEDFIRNEIRGDI
jgi:hypothetical protein